MRKNKRINKAIKGRRNRLHALKAIFVYPSYDQTTFNALKECLEASPNPMYMIIPDVVKVIIP